MGDGAMDKIKGKTKEAAGNVQESWGKATDQPEHEMEGEARQAEGKGDQVKGNIKDAGASAKDAIRDATR